MPGAAICPLAGQLPQPRHDVGDDAWMTDRQTDRRTDGIATGVQISHASSALQCTALSSVLHYRSSVAAAVRSGYKV